MSILVIRKVTNCSRCGLEHTNLEAVSFSQQPTGIVLNGKTITHWVMCPVNGDPILVANYEEPLKEVGAGDDYPVILPSNQKIR